MSASNTTTTPSPDHSDQPQQSCRYHDLDALRAFAMLLGIALHAALAFAPIPWIVMNDETTPVLGTFFEVTHCFRLPLFFLMSGFFSAMLLQRRGVIGFLTHRWKRIGLPLLLGMVTIIPATWGVFFGGNALTSMVPPPEREWATIDDSSTLWSAAAAGDIVTVQLLLRSGESANTPDPKLGVLPLAWAATGDHAEIVASLLDAGADPNLRMGDDNIPLHTACFFGAAQCAELMLEGGADPSTVKRFGETPADAMRHERGTVEFIANLLGVTIEFGRVESGRRDIAKAIETDRRIDGHDEPSSPIRDHILGVLSGEVLMHLWFLWHLCLLACALALVVLALRLLPWLRAPRIIVATPLCLAGLVPLTAITQSWQSGFGPDTSAALIPAPHVLAHYAVFFGFGALMQSTATAVDRLGRTCWVYLSIAAIACFVALRLVHNPTVFAGVDLDPKVGTRAAIVLQAVFAWTVSFGSVGLARLVLGRPSSRVRYVSDASYWLYVTHFPVVVAGQFGLVYVPLPPVLAFALLTTVTTAVLLFTYQWFVRYTWIGHLLNGMRVRPGHIQTPRQS